MDEFRFDHTPRQLLIIVAATDNHGENVILTRELELFVCSDYLSGFPHWHERKPAPDHYWTTYQPALEQALRSLKASEN